MKQHLPARDPVFGSHRSLERLFAAPRRETHTFVNFVYPTRTPSSSIQHELEIILFAMEGEDDKASKIDQPWDFRLETGVSLLDSFDSVLSSTTSSRHSELLLTTASAKYCRELKT